jgi:AraC-like DNA-binding protein
MAGRPKLETKGPSALPPALLRLVRARGLDPSPIAAAGRLDLDAAEHADEVAIAPSSAAQMLRLASEHLADPHAALALPAELPFRHYDALALAARAAASPRAVAGLVVTYAPLVFPGLAASVDASPAELRMTLSLPGHPRGLGLATDEYVIAAVLALVTRGGGIAPRRAWIASPRPPSIAPLFAALGTSEIDFGADDTGFALAAEAADRPLPGADPRLLATATHLASAALANVPRKGAFADVVATRIAASLGRGEAPAADAIAADLHMSTRTLQRRLDDEGTRFSDVLERARERRARELLADESLALAEIAYRTGFADLATFSRAFKRWSGMPPGAYRRRTR